MTKSKKVQYSYYAAKIEDNYYHTLEEACDASGAGDTIELLKNIALSEPLKLKDGASIFVPHGLKLHAGLFTISGKVGSEAALYLASGECTYYGLLTEALQSVSYEGDEVYAYGKITLENSETITIPYGTTLRIPYLAELTVMGDMNVSGEIIIMGNLCTLHTYGSLNIEGSIIVEPDAILWMHNSINLQGGKLLIAGALMGEGEIDANVKVFSKKSSALNYYSRLNDALDDLQTEEENEIIALKDVNGFYGLTIPAASKLIIPTGITFTLDTDAMLNIEGTLSIADKNALTGNTEVDLNFSENAILLGEGLSGDSNFYEGQEKASAVADSRYLWAPIDTETYEEAWLKEEE